MKNETIRKVVFRIWVEEFYRKNTGFFIVVALLLTGVFSGGSLLLLADLAVHNFYILAAGYFLPFLLYHWKVFDWGNSLIRTRENNFFLHMLLLPLSKQVLHLTRTQASLLAPLLPFSILLLQRAWSHNCLLPAAMILLFNAVMLLVPVAFWIRQLQYPADLKVNHSASILNLRWLGGPSGWLLRHLIQVDAMLLLRTKVLSFFFTAGALVLYHSDDYDQRLLNLALLAAGFLHLGILDEFGQLERHLAFLRNLPFSLFGRTRFRMMILLPLLLPEMLLFVRNCPTETGWFFRLTAPFFFFSLVMLLNEIRAALDPFPHRKINILPTLFFASSFGIMSGIPAFVFCLIFSSASMLLHKLFYFKTGISDHG